MLANKSNQRKILTWKLAQPCSLADQYQKELLHTVFEGISNKKRG